MVKFCLCGNQILAGRSDRKWCSLKCWRWFHDAGKLRIWSGGDETTPLNWERLDARQPSQESTPEEVAIRLDMQRWVLAKVDRIPNHKNRLVVLCFFGLGGFETMTLSSIGKMLGVGCNMACIRLRKALKFLKYVVQ